jgi:hypothetical protein
VFLVLKIEDAGLNSELSQASSFVIVDVQAQKLRHPDFGNFIRNYKFKNFNLFRNFSPG